MSATKEWAIGSQVVLISGGPIMIVEGKAGSADADRVVCTWFEGQKKKCDRFHVDTLRAWARRGAIRVST
jgi:uncharacterized protein YodC (DUF2158 family)